LRFSSSAKLAASVSHATATEPSTTGSPGYAAVGGSNFSSNAVPPPASTFSAASPTTPVVQSGAGTVSSATANTSAVQAANYEVNFKDQSRSVIGSPAAMPSLGGPVAEDVPFAVAFDICVGSGGSNRTKSEPAGRRMEDKVGFKCSGVLC
jgi:hypothetical protein